MKKQKIYESDSIRGICCILVILYHYTTRYCEAFTDLNYPFSVPFGHMAVCSFFALSGFLCLYTGKEEISLISYFKNKFIRLYPVFWVAMIITTLVCMVALPQVVVSIKDFILNLTMAPELLKAKTVDGAYWTLLRELVFYCFIAVVLKLKLKNKINIISLVWLIALFVLYFVNLKFDNVIITLINYATIYNYAQQFIAGMMIYQIYKSNSLKQLVFSSINLVLCLMCNFITRGVGYTIFLAITVLFVLIAVLNSKFNFYTLSEQTIGLLKPLAFIASISYPVYLIHQNLGYAIINLFETNGITTELVIIIPIAVSIMLGWLLHKFVEIPTSKFLRKILFKG